MQRNFIQAMAAIHLALTAGLGFFTIVAFALVLTNKGVGLMGQIPQDFELIMYAIVYGAALSTTGFGIIVFERNMRHAKAYTFMKEKAEIFKSAYLIRIGLAGGPGFLGLIAFMLTANYYYLPATAICLWVIVTSRPTVDFVADRLYLTDKEKEALPAQTI